MYVDPLPYTGQGNSRPLGMGRVEIAQAHPFAALSQFVGNQSPSIEPWQTPEAKAANVACNRAKDAADRWDEMTAVIVAERAVESAKLRLIAADAEREYWRIVGQ